MKHNEFYKLLFRYIIFAVIAGYVFGCSKPCPIEEMTPPIIIVRKDSVTVVKDKNGSTYEMTRYDETMYGTIFMEVGDTIICYKERDAKRNN